MNVRLGNRSPHLAASDGTTILLDVGLWNGNATQRDETVLQDVRGPVLDIGCGPGRHVYALATRGVAALGIDVAPTAVWLAQAKGVPVLERSVFDRVPGAGRWKTALLLDGNIGIGGDPVPLLRRIADLLAPDGRIVIEVDPPGTSTTSLEVNLVTEATVSERFPWAVVGVNGLAAVASASDLEVYEVGCVDGRWFGWLAA